MCIWSHLWFHFVHLDQSRGELNQSNSRRKAFRVSWVSLQIFSCLFLVCLLQGFQTSYLKMFCDYLSCLCQNLFNWEQCQWVIAISNGLQESDLHHRYNHHLDWRTQVHLASSLEVSCVLTCCWICHFDWTSAPHSQSWPHPRQMALSTSLSFCPSLYVHMWFSQCYNKFH